MKEFIVYSRGEILVYIHRGSRKIFNGKRWIQHKTFWYGIRRNDKSGFGHILGVLQFDGAWRQFIFAPEPKTKWCKSCLEKINEFLDILNKSFRKKHKK